MVFLRRDKAGRELICAINFNPNTYEDYRFGCPPCKEYVEVFNSDAAVYGGTGAVNKKPCKVSWEPSHGQEASVSIKIPPFGAVFLRGRGKPPAKPAPEDGAEAVETAAKAPVEKPKRGRPAGKKATVKTAKKETAPAEKKPASRARKKAAPSAE